MLHGAGAFRQAVAEKLALARLCDKELLAWIAGGQSLEVVAAPKLSTLAFRLRRLENEALCVWNQRNQRLIDATSGFERVQRSSTSLPTCGGMALTLRVCVLSFRTHEEQLGHFLEDPDRALFRRPGLVP